MAYLLHSQIGQPSKDLSKFQEEISNRFQGGETVQEIAEFLKAEYDFQVNSRTIQRRLRE